MSIAVVGRFPPPIDGQTLATERMCRLLEPTLNVIRCDIQPKDSSARLDSGLTARRALHFAHLRSRLKRQLMDRDLRIALWPAISPDLAGHVRDRWAVVPALKAIPQIAAIVHRGNFDKLFQSPVSSRSALRLVTRVRLFVFLSSSLSQRCERWIPSAKRKVVPNTIDDSLVLEAGELSQRQVKRENRKRLELLFVGNMIAEKGYLDVLRAAARLRSEQQQVRVRFVGRWMSDGDDGRFRSLSSELGVEDVVEHLGPISDRRAMRSIYCDSDVLLLPSYYPNEAQPLVLLEALNAGLPVVSTRHGGIPDIIDDGVQGFLIAPRDVDALAAAVGALREYGRWLTFSNAARRRFESKFSPEAVRDQWLNVIHALGEA